MVLIPQIAAELRLRSKLLPGELHHWQHDADANVDGAGLHQSQVKAIKILFQELEGAQGATLTALTQEADLPAFKTRRLELEQELTGTHGLLSIFRFVLGQREDQRYYRAALDFADLVAADCYRPCIERAASWEAIDETRFRAPPLTYLNAMLSPAAFTRRHAFGAFRLPIEGASERKLPISIVSLPFHHTSAVWTFCALHHEVGHVLDQDLGLYEAIKPLLEGGLADQRRAVWSGWLREMIADCFGVLLGHAGYAPLLVRLLLLPDPLVTEPNPLDKHPTPYIRIMLVAALMKAIDSKPLAELADSITKEWQKSYPQPAALDPFLAECEQVAALLMNSPLPSLKSHTLRDFAPAQDIANEDASAKKLATYLQTGHLRPKPDQLRPRLVPVAAQMAAAAVVGDHEASYAKIQVRALEYMKDLREEMPVFLAEDKFVAGGPAGTSAASREQYYRQLVRGLSFTGLDESED